HGPSSLNPTRTGGAVTRSLCNLSRKWLQKLPVRSSLITQCGACCVTSVCNEEKAMRMRSQRRYAVVAGVAALGLVLSACGGADDLGGGGGGADDGADDNGDVSAECAEFEQYGTFDGETVTLFSSIREVEADQLQDTFDQFTE